MGNNYSKKKRISRINGIIMELKIKGDNDNFNNIINIIIIIIIIIINIIIY